MALTTNRFLERLTQGERTHIGGVSERVTLRRGDLLCDAGDALQYAYFPEECVLSLLAVLSDGTQIEIATIGHEGAFGTLASMGNPIASCRCMVQVEGDATRIPTSWLRTACARDPKLIDHFVRYAQVTSFQVQQSAACNALHPVEARLSRWLIEMSDRGDTDRLALTHEFLASILGANRATVSVAAASLQERGCIVYRRGAIAIQDRAGLESACCECYAAVRDHTELLLGSRPDKHTR
jgi:CRP-like cAMP-binding protein